MMKSLELQPTPENLFKTYESDAIGRNESLYHFVDILDLLDEAHSISLDGQWGSGKTFFVKQAKMILDAVNPSVDKDEDSVSKKFADIIQIKYPARNFKPQVSVYYDAWEHDNDEDPLLSVIYEIIQSVNSDYDFTKSKDVLNIFANIADVVTGRNITALINSIRSSEDVFANMKDNRTLREKINEFFEYILPEHGERLVVFIDELDRCNPSYAVKLLERVKHYFNHEKVTFVLAINSLELQNTIKQHYGTEFNACKYLDRFFDMRISLPSADMEKFYSSIGFSDYDNTYDQVVTAVAKKYQFEPREAAKFIRMTKIAAHKPTHSDRGNYSNPYGVSGILINIVPIMIGLKMYDSATYMNFVEGRNPAPLIDIFDTDDFSYVVKYYLFSRNELDNPDLKATNTDRLKLLYRALFASEYSSSNYETRIGNTTINGRKQAHLKKIASLLSNYADYSY